MKEKQNKKAEKQQSSSVKRVIGTPWKKGQSGNPAGRPKQAKLYSDALKEILESKKIEITLTGPDDKVKTISATADKNFYHCIAAAQVIEATKGNVNAAREIADRVQGKAVQPIDIEEHRDIHLHFDGQDDKV